MSGRADLRSSNTKKKRHGQTGIAVIASIGMTEETHPLLEVSALNADRDGDSIARHATSFTITEIRRKPK